MATREQVGGLERRLPWLLVFRGAVATGLLLVTLAAEVASWHVRLQSVVLYGAVVSSFLVVFVLGLLLRAGLSAVVLSAVHLTTTVMVAVMVVQATGGVASGFAFLFLLVIMEGAIIGGQAVALVVATASSLAFGAQLTLQLYRVFPAGLQETPPPGQFVNGLVIHLIAFYAIALLAGRLAYLFESSETAARAARTDLQRVEAFQAAVLASLPVGVVTVGTDGQVQTANQAAARILRSPIRDLINRPLPAIIQEVLRSDRRHTETTGEREGSTLHLAVSRAPVAYPTDAGDGEHGTLQVLVIEDRTELQSLHETLRARERLASLGQMAAAIAHELRNPLAAISGSVELLRSETDHGGETRARLEAIVLREIERLNVLVDDFLVYARPAPPEQTPTDLAALLRDIAAVFRQDSTFAGHAIEVDAPPELVVSLDAAQIRQMMWNLLRNAAEASPLETPIELCLTTNRGEAHIAVRDRGPGVAPEIRRRLFEPFQTTKDKGTGLGLAIVHNIVTAHGGDVALQPRSGGGTETRVVLPLS